MRLAVAILSVVIGAGAAVAQQTGPYMLTPADVELVQQSVRAKMLDPQSAMFGPMKAAYRATSKVGAVMVCGVVNGKNTFGGYAGRTVFDGMLWTHEGQRRFDLVGNLSADDVTITVTLKACRQEYGIDLGAP